MQSLLRSDFGIFFLTMAIGALHAQAPIDRAALVGRHAIHLSQLDPDNPLTVGNGDFAFTVDATGLQSFGAYYHDHGVPLETRATWAWHEFPNPSGFTLRDAMKPYPFHGRTIEYAALQDSPAGEYFRENPHPIPLGEISLLYRGQPLALGDITAVDQTLDLWTGVITSRYLLAGQPVAVETSAAPERSVLAIKLRSPLVARGDLQVRFHFPYSYQMAVKNKPPSTGAGSTGTAPKRCRSRPSRSSCAAPWTRTPTTPSTSPGTASAN